MNAELYDLAPALRLMLMGLALALGPLGWVWLRNPKASPARRLQALTVLTLFLTFDLVLFGAFTRLTDSGLGCPDWPGCYGNASPVGAHAEISAAQSAMPTGPVTHGKAWVEMVHRYLATAVGVLILTLALGSWQAARRGRSALPVNPWWPTLTLVWVCLQGAFGALTVTMKLFPAVVTLHLLGGLVLLALLTLQAVRHKQAHRGGARLALPTGLRHGLIWVMVALVLQIVLGGWVSTNYAVLACSDFPLCQQSAWPPMDFVRGFTVWRELGHNPDGSLLPFAALTAIHYTHRLFAFVVLAALGWLAARLAGQPGFGSVARAVAGLALLQFLTGLSNVVFDWPLLSAVAHTGGAAGLVLALTWGLAASRAESRRDLRFSTPRWGA